MDLIRDLWRGDVPLVKTFWIFGFSINLLFTVAVGYLIYHPEVSETGIGRTILLLLIVANMIYAPFILVAIWRSANKYEGLRRYAIAAKIAVFFGWANYIQSIAEVADEMSGC